ncbi:MAG: PKD domain-containing protein, partial [Bacteroidota bacterium]
QVDSTWEVVDTFEPDLNQNLWASIQEGMVSTLCGSNSGNQALLFPLPGFSSIPRFAETIDMDLRFQPEVSFSLFYGDGQGACYAPDNGEGVSLFYSVDGGSSWTFFNYFDPLVLTPGTFTDLTVSLPANASTSSTRLRWIQAQHSGFGSDIWALDDVRITAGEALVFNPQTDTVLAGDSVMVQVLVNTSGLPTGDFETEGTLASNDPVNPVMTLPVDIHVIRTPILNLSDSCLVFGPVQQYSQEIQFLTIQNTGCDTLEVALALNHPAFAIGDSVLVLSPDSSVMLAVTFSPDSVGTLDATLELMSNAGDRSVCLSGMASPVPSLAFHPDTLFMLANCGDSSLESAFITLYNTGGASLLMDSIKTGPIFKEDSSVLLIRDAATMGTLVDTFLMNAYGITPTITGSVGLENVDLEEFDLIMTTGAQSAVYYDKLNQRQADFEAFVHQGGIVQYMTAASGDSVLLAGGVSSASLAIDNIHYNAALTHPITQDKPLFLDGDWPDAHNKLLNLPPNADILTISADTNAVTTATYTLGEGHVIATGMPWEYEHRRSTNSRGLLRAATNFSLFQATRIEGTWGTVSPDMGMLSPGDSIEINLVLETDSLAAGLYSTQLLIFSDDPLNPIQSIPVMIRVSPIGTLTPAIQTNGLLEAGVSIGFRVEGSAAEIETLWEFGDGTTAQGDSVSHVYASPGTYVVQLTLTDSLGCQLTILDSLVIDTKLGISAEPSPGNLKVYPNPTNGAFWVEYEAQTQETRLEVINSLGQVILTQPLKGLTHIHTQIAFPPGTAQGLYTIRIQDGPYQAQERIFLED